MNLHEDKTRFRQAVQFTSDQMQLPAIYVEKDYWVTVALHAIFTAPIGADAVFKGGTSLSKCHKLIDRFSEDIDMVVIRRTGESDSRMKAKLKEVSTAVETVLPEIHIEGITNKLGMIRKTAHRYAIEAPGKFGQVRDAIVLESSWLGHPEPWQSHTIQSFIGQVMLKNGQADLAASFNLVAFPVFSLEPTRTICEKIMSLVRFSYGSNPVDDLKAKIRHAYDLHQLLREPTLSVFFDSPAFDAMLARVAQGDIEAYRNNNEWLVHHPRESKIFANLDEVWPELKSAYEGEFKNLVYGDFPPAESVLATLQRIQTRLDDLGWTITLPEK